MNVEKDIAEIISNLSSLEASELVKLLQKKWGVAVASPTRDETEDAGSEEALLHSHYTEGYDVILTEIGSHQLNVIKEVRAITGLGLEESRALVKSVPSAIREGLSKAEAQELETKLAAAGGTARVIGYSSWAPDENFSPKYVQEHVAQLSKLGKSTVALGVSEDMQAEDAQGSSQELTDEEWEEAKLLAAKMVQEKHLGTLGEHLNLIKNRSIRKK